MPLSDYLIGPSSRQRMILHLLLWLTVFGIRFYFIEISFNVYSGFPLPAVVALSLYSTCLIAGMYYIILWIAARIWQKGKFTKAFFTFFGLLLIYTILDAVLEKNILLHCNACMVRLHAEQPGYDRLVSSDLPNIVLKRFLSFGTPLTLLFNLMIPFFIKMGVSTYRETVLRIKLQRENLELELNFLKAQLNPHFLFNSMNNIYGLVLAGDKQKSAELIAGLSNMLRYVLYETNEYKLPLEKEIKLIRDYMDLEKVRLNHVEVSFSFVADASAYNIAPLLLIQLIENAFKHCVDRQGAYINCSITAEAGRLKLHLSNTADANAAPGGIGLANLRRRLDMYYPGAYHYAVSASDVYIVELEIPI